MRMEDIHFKRSEIKSYGKSYKNKKFKASKNSRLCSKHFKSDYQEICATTGLPPLCRHLKKVLFLPFSHGHLNSTSAIERQNRYMEVSKERIIPPQNPIETLTGNYSMEDRNEVSDKEENSTEVQMEIEIKTHEKENTVSYEPKDQSGL
ncbi:hypothetical protein EVAR_19334_1 [Eumeta japonica]|uniref:Uncharacterized protein n=1 Tax=Eumeta variegata TaxID=151549 RepID=A0A4C1TRC0_EUMVA|nr:hypothetical protein EVAR_19334_1 [Eumeta japonica]